MKKKHPVSIAILAGQWLKKCRSSEEPKNFISLHLRFHDGSPLYLLSALYFVKLQSYRIGAFSIKIYYSYSLGDKLIMRYEDLCQKRGLKNLMVI